MWEPAVIYRPAAKQYAATYPAIQAWMRVVSGKAGVVHNEQGHALFYKSRPLLVIDGTWLL